jgi:hypothetical protein
MRLSSESDAAFMEPDMACPFSKIIQSRRLPELLDDPEITSFAAVDLNDIEDRITRALTAD